MEIDLALASGARVRALPRRHWAHGTVIGCFLVERGCAAEQALEQLNELWKQCARSASWPLVPQTEAQADFIRAWRPHRAAPWPRGRYW